MSELVGVMLVDSGLRVRAGASKAATVRVPTVGMSFMGDIRQITWSATVVSDDEPVVTGTCTHLAEFALPIGEQPSSAAIDTAIAQAYDAFCLQYDIWRRASHIEWLPVLPMSLGVEPGQRSGTWKFAAGPAPKTTSPEGQAPSGGKQKQHGKKGNDRAAGKAGVGRRSKRG